MKILIDIGHPAHVHYFKNFIKIMEKKGHEFLIVAREKEVTHMLLRSFGIDFKSRGKGKRSLLGKVFYTLKADLILFNLARDWKPNLLMSFGSPYTAHVAKLIGKPHIAFTDTEHARLGILAFAPFSDVILTPDSFYKDFPNKQLRFKGYMELCYLHPNYYKPDPSILDLLGVKKDEKYVILRFISWDASHDVGYNGISLEEKEKLVADLSKYAKIFISSERPLPSSLEKFRIQIPPDRIHDAMAFASLFVGEGGTMATECGMLGTPNVLINSLAKFCGTHNDLMKNHKLQLYFNSLNEAHHTILNLIINNNSKREWAARRDEFLSKMIDVNSFIEWVITSYPESISILKQNPDYSNNFK